MCNFCVGFVSLRLPVLVLMVPGEEFFVRVVYLKSDVASYGRLFRSFPLKGKCMRVLSRVFRGRAPSFSVSTSAIKHSSDTMRLASGSANTVRFEGYNVSNFAITEILRGVHRRHVLLRRSPIVALLVNVGSVNLVVGASQASSRGRRVVERFTARCGRLLGLLAASTERMVLVRPFVFPRPRRCRA